MLFLPQSGPIFNFNTPLALYVKWLEHATRTHLVLIHLFYLYFRPRPQNGHYSNYVSKGSNGAATIRSDVKVDVKSPFLAAVRC